jgi:hypothetical protein
MRCCKEVLLATMSACALTTIFSFMPTALAQDKALQVAHSAGIEGTWQGILRTPDGRDLSLILRIAKDEKGGLSAILYRPDQGGPPMPGDSVRFEEETLRFVK